MAHVTLVGNLRQFTGGVTEIEVAAQNVHQLFARLGEKYPALLPRTCKRAQRSPSMDKSTRTPCSRRSVLTAMCISCRKSRGMMGNAGKMHCVACQSL